MWRLVISCLSMENTNNKRARQCDHELAAQFEIKCIYHPHPHPSHSPRDARWNFHMPVCCHTHVSECIVGDSWWVLGLRWDGQLASIIREQGIQQQAAWANRSWQELWCCSQWWHRQSGSHPQQEGKWSSLHMFLSTTGVALTWRMTWAMVMMMMMKIVAFGCSLPEPFWLDGVYSGWHP